MVKRGDVLVVDDDPSITEWLHRTLSAKHEIRQAHSVADALLAVGLRAPDALVTDLGMDDLGGEHLLAFVASAFPDVRRIVYSATLQHRLSWTVDSGLAHVAIDKTGEVVELEEALDRVLAARYRQMALEPCGTKPPAELVRDFLSRPFSFDAYADWLNGQG